MRLSHTSTHKGKRVRVKLRSGEVIVDKFVERTDIAIHLQDTGWINKKDLQKFSIYKEQWHEMK